MAANGIKQHGHANNLRRHQQYNFRFENRTTIPSEHNEGLAYYGSNAGNKHLYYCVDDTVPVYARVLRGDTAETITGLWTFHPASAGSQPFAVHSNGTGRVDNLNADRVDSFHASQSVVANTLATRNGDGTLSGADPTSNEHFVTLGYVTNLIDNYDPKDPCEAATTGNIDVSSAPATFDGYAASNGDRIFVWQQVAGEENGIRIFQGVGNPMPRASDADEDNEVTSGMQTFIRGGNTHTGAIFMLKTADPIVLDTDALEFVQVGGNTLYSDGRGLTKSGNTFHAVQSGAYSVGDLVFANSADTLTFLTAVATGNVLKSGGETTAPVWGKVDLTADVTGTLGVTNGGTGNPNQFTKGSVVFASDNGVYSQSNTLFFWDEGNNALGLGTKTLTAGNRLQVNLGRIAISDGYNIGDVDGNTGFFVNADAVNLQTAGTTRFKIDSSGNAGLGLTTYSSRLTVKDSTDTGLSHGIQIIRSANADSGYINVQGGALSFNTVNNAGTGALPIQWALNGVVAMKMDTAGNLAINDNPEAGWRLNVGGAIRSDAGEGNVSYGMSGWDFVRWDNANEIELGGITGSQFQVLNFWTAGAYRGHVNATGTWTLANPSSGATLVANMLDNQVGAIVFQQGLNEYLTIDTLNGGELIVYGNTTTSPRHIFYGGNVGIGGSGSTTLDVISNNANPIRLYRNGVNASLQTENNVGSAYFGINTGGNACIGHVLDQTNAPFQIAASGVVKLTAVNAGSSNEVLVHSSGSLVEKRTINAGAWTTNLGANRLALTNSSGELTSSSSFTYSGPRVGMNYAISGIAALRVGTVDDPVTVNSTTYEIGIIALSSNCYDISTGVTDSGYRAGMFIEGVADDADFEGSLAAQYGLYLKHGASATGVGAVIQNSYGLFIASVDTASADIQNLWGLYQSNSAAKNYFAGKVGIGVSPATYKVEVSGDVAIQNAYGFRVGGVEDTYVGQLTNDLGVLHLEADGTRDIEFGNVTNGVHVFIEGSNGNVGIGTTEPLNLLHLYKNSTSEPVIYGENEATAADAALFGMYGRWSGSNVAAILFRTGDDTVNKDDGEIGFYTSNSGGSLVRRLRLRRDGVFNFGNSANHGMLSWNTNLAIVGALSGNDLALYANSTEKLRINTSGNIGFGTTDIESWNSDYRVIEFPESSIMFGNLTIGLYFNSNAYFDGTWKYKTTDKASRYYQNNGQHVFSVAASGTIDTAISWTTALTINNDGTLTAGVLNTGTGNSILTEESGVIKKRTIDSRAWSGGGLVDGSGNTQSLAFWSDSNTLSSYSSLQVNGSGQLLGGFGAATTSGVLDWDDSSNARPGNGYALLQGTSTNGPSADHASATHYFHPFSFEYSSKNGTGNMTQFAIPYNGVHMLFRYRFSGVWTAWYNIWNSGNDGPGSGLHADLLDGQEGSYYLTATNIGGLGNNRVVVTEGAGKLTSDSALLWDGNGLAIGTSVSALLTLGAGGTTKAPLKFGAGPLLTTPQVGAMEFSNETEPTLYFTRKAGARKRVVLVHEEDIGDGSNSTFTIIHDLGAKPVSVVGTFNATGETFEPDWDVIDNDTISVTYLEVLSTDEVSIRVAA